VTALDRVEIHYRRLPDRLSIFRQRVVHRDAEVVVTLLEAAQLAKPVRVDGVTVLEAGAPVVWFTYPGRWHDIGRFHTADGRFTGIYANVLTPVRMRGDVWSTTDLCLDVWLGEDGVPRLLDEDELREAERRGWTDMATAARARSEAAALMESARAGAWPPAHVHEWTLARASAIPSTSSDHTP
jgi:predicted RNA-binding protein associated with RNAse of E/G family